MANILRNFYRDISRKKTYDSETIHTSQLKRCLTVFDLTILGIGSTLGTGTYILTGQVAHNTAGPSVILSFLFAAIASILAGLCYAEFGARAPRAGSAYTYTYVSVGEIVAFIIGWNMILEYVIGAASTARALSSYFDSLIDGRLSNFSTEHFSMGSSFLAPYADPFAMGLCLFITVLLVVGVKESAVLNNVFTAVNLIVIAIVIIAGLTKAHTDNWTVNPQTINNLTNSTKDIGQGGFFPFGIEGTLAGAATCFYAFVGFDLVATTGEESKNPQRAIPISICLTLIVCSIIYCAVAIVITLMVPYYQIDPNAVLPEAFHSVGYPALKYVVGVGALAGIFTSLLGSLLPLPRVLYAIASDGLIFRFISWIHPRLQTPIVATVLGGVSGAIMALIFDLMTLVEMMSIGTLLAYSLVSVSVLFLRYQPSDDLLLEQNNISLAPFHQELICPSQPYPTEFSARVSKYLIAFLTVNSFIICAIQIFAGNGLAHGEPATLTFFILSVLVEIVLLLILKQQPMNRKSLYFETPFVPFTPILSILANIYLILKLQPPTWIRFAVWMFVGFAIYGGYGLRNSSQRSVDASKRNHSTSQTSLISS